MKRSRNWSRLGKINIFSLSQTSKERLNQLFSMASSLMKNISKERYLYVRRHYKVGHLYTHSNEVKWEYLHMTFFSVFLCFFLRISVKRILLDLSAMHNFPQLGSGDF